MHQTVDYWVFRQKFHKSIDTKSNFVTMLTTMSQDLMRTLQTKGAGKGHTYNVRFNNKNKKDPSQKLTLKKYNKITRQHEEYKQKK